MYLVFGGFLSFKEGFSPLFFLCFYLKYFVYNMSAHFNFLRIIRLINLMETLGNCVIGGHSFALCSQYLTGSWAKHLLFRIFLGNVPGLGVLWGGCMMLFRCGKLNWEILWRNGNAEIPSSLGSVFLILIWEWEGENSGWSTERTEKHWEGGRGGSGRGWHGDSWKDWRDNTCSQLWLSHTMMSWLILLYWRLQVFFKNM